MSDFWQGFLVGGALVLINALWYLHWFKVGVEEAIAAHFKEQEDEQKL